PRLPYARSQSLCRSEHSSGVPAHSAPAPTTYRSVQALRKQYISDASHKLQCLICEATRAPVFVGGARTPACRVETRLDSSRRLFRTRSLACPDSAPHL